MKAKKGVGGQTWLLSLNIIMAQMSISTQNIHTITGEENHGL